MGQPHFKYEHGKRGGGNPQKVQGCSGAIGQFLVQEWIVFQVSDTSYPDAALSSFAQGYSLL